MLYKDICSDISLTIQNPSLQSLPLTNQTKFLTIYTLPYFCSCCPFTSGCFPSMDAWWNLPHFSSPSEMPTSGWRLLRCHWVLKYLHPLGFHGLFVHILEGTYHFSSYCWSTFVVCPFRSKWLESKMWWLQYFPNGLAHTREYILSKWVWVIKFKCYQLPYFSPTY